MPLKIQILLHIDFRHLKIINVYLPLPEVVPHQTEHHSKKCVTCLTVGGWANSHILAIEVSAIKSLDARQAHVASFGTQVQNQ